MPKLPKALWLNVSPSFKVYDQPLLRSLSCQVSIARWEYCQTQDEASSPEIALMLLHDYLKAIPHPVHLVGHGTSGLVGLLYARRYPEKVASLTLLAVGAQPAIDWQAHYYAQLKFFSCDRKIVLRQVVHSLFGYQSREMAMAMAEILEADLKFSPSPHTLIQQVSLLPGNAGVPMLVCGSRDDSVISPHDLEQWRSWLGERDMIWQCPNGRHFFHYAHPKLVSKQILNFWTSLIAEGVQASPKKTLV